VARRRFADEARRRGRERPGHDPGVEGLEQGALLKTSLDEPPRGQDERVRAWSPRDLE
jgi:hypothetical protein